MSIQSGDINKAIESRLSDFESPVVAVIINPLYYSDSSIALARYFIERFQAGLYVSLNKPVQAVKKLMEKAAVRASGIHFIDCVTSTSERQQEDCYFLGKQPELTNLCLSLSKVVNTFKDSRFMIVDSLSTLLIYNDARSVTRFAHLLAEKMRVWGLASALITVYMREEKELMPYLAQFCDSTVTLGV